MNNEEEVMQAECTKWFWNTFIAERRMLFHVDNNSYNGVIGARKKALGVCRGPSDLIFVLPGEVVFIELKTPSGSQSEEQLDFEMKVKHRGHKYVIIRSVGAFQDFIINKIYGK